MTQVFAVAKIGKNALTATDPNDFIFHSEYNTFKIIFSGVKSVTHNGSPATQVFSQAHGLRFIPLVTAFLKVDGESQAYPPNGIGVLVATAKAMITNGVHFDYIESDITNIYFSVTTSSSKDISIRYFLLEKI